MNDFRAPSRLLVLLTKGVWSAGLFFFVSQAYATKTAYDPSAFPFYTAIHLCITLAQLVPLAGLVFWHPRPTPNFEALRIVWLVLATPCLLLGVAGTLLWFAVNPR